MSTGNQISKSQAVEAAQQWKDHTGIWPSKRMLCRPMRRARDGGRIIFVGYYPDDGRFVLMAELYVGPDGTVKVKKDRRYQRLHVPPPPVHEVEYKYRGHAP